MNVFDMAWARACEILPPFMNTPQARVVIQAIGYQESNFEHWRQVRGPAHGFWQFEREGGVRGVMNHAHTRRPAIKVADACRVPWVLDTIYQALPYNDVLACGFARLLLYSLPDPLPDVGDQDGAWKQYLEAWRPGKPHPERWGRSYGRAD